jgi:hypothetical protein
MLTRPIVRWFQTKQASAAPEKVDVKEATATTITYRQQHKGRTNKRCSVDRWVEALRKLKGGAMPFKVTYVYTVSDDLFEEPLRSQVVQDMMERNVVLLSVHDIAEFVVREYQRGGYYNNYVVSDQTNTWKE